MSLKARIIFLTVTVTAIIVIALFLVQLNNVIESWTGSSFEIAQMAGQQAKHMLIVRLAERASAVPAGVSKEEDRWTALVREDRNLTALLEDTMAQAHSIIEISIAGRDGTVVASSNPLRPGQALAPAPELSALTASSPFRRLNLLLRGARQYELRIPLGLAQQQQPVFTIQVLVSSVLLRSDLIPAMRSVAGWGLASLLASVLLAYASARLAVGNLTRLGRVIDEISRGETPPPLEPRVSPAPEFAILESKLNLLGHQVRGARDDATELRSNVQKMLEGLEEAILLFDPNHRLTLCGGASRRILGFSIEQIAGRSTGEIFPPETALGALVERAFRNHDNIRDAAVEGLLVSIEFTRVAKAPRRFSALMTIRDARHHQHLESKLDLSERLDAMSRITSSVAHEIKNPLNSIAARLDYLQSWATSDFPEAEQEIQTIFREVNRLDRVVRTFLDFTRPVELAREEVDMVGLAREIADLVRPDAARKGVSVRFCGSKDAIFVRGDQDLLKEAILNIATNGIEAMRQGGELAISVARDNGQCRVTISDQGPGIPEAEREKIFQLYFTTKENGSGLGLPMSYRAIQLHGGAIRVESAPGQGASFHLNVPIMEDGNRN
jgi:signal transduction histidine kinase